MDLRPGQQQKSTTKNRGDTNAIFKKHDGHQKRRSHQQQKSTRENQTLENSYLL